MYFVFVRLLEVKLSTFPHLAAVFILPTPMLVFVIIAIINLFFFVILLIETIPLKPQQVSADDSVLLQVSCC